MTSLAALTLFVLLAGPGPKDGWEVARQDDDLTVYAREKKGTGVQEMKAVGTIDAAPERVWKAVRDYSHYPKTMPYTDVSKIVAKEQGEKIIYLYSVIDAPFVDKRDYTIKLVDESQWKDGKGFFKVTWTAANDRSPKKEDDVVRVQINDGYWLIEPKDGGKKSLATYYVYTDPGGSVPRWLVNRANGSAVPDVFDCVRKAATK